MKNKKPSNAFNEPMIKVGCDEKSVAAARAAINDILASPAADAAKVRALETLHGLCGVQNVQIQDCTLSQGCTVTEPRP